MIHKFIQTCRFCEKKFEAGFNDECGMACFLDDTNDVCPDEECRKKFDEEYEKYVEEQIEKLAREEE